MIGKLTKLHADYRSDPETRDRDTELKAKTKACADQAANVKPSDIQVGDRVLVSGTKYSFVKKFMMDDPVSTPVHPLSASPDKIVVHTTVPSQALSELTRVAHATPPSDPPTRSTLSAQNVKLSMPSIESIFDTSMSTVKTDVHILPLPLENNATRTVEVERVIQDNINLNVRDLLGRTLLHMAVEQGNYDFAFCLMQARCNPNAREMC
ncbi:hypothetical protein ACROYT_G022478 [Oculina patagonica]